jgi:hypothetical protein
MQRETRTLSHTYNHTTIHPSIHTYIHTYMHAYIHTYTQPHTRTTLPCPPARRWICGGCACSTDPSVHMHCALRPLSVMHGCRSAGRPTRQRRGRRRRRRRMGIPTWDLRAHWRSGRRRWLRRSARPWMRPTGLRRRSWPPSQRNSVCCAPITPCWHRGRPSSLPPPAPRSWHPRALPHATVLVICSLCGDSGPPWPRRRLGGPRARTCPPWLRPYVYPRLGM